MNDNGGDREQPVPPGRERPERKLPPADDEPREDDGPAPVEDPRPDRPKRRASGAAA